MLKTLCPSVYYALQGNPLDYDLMMEQSEYLNGILWAEPDHRLDMDSSRNVSDEIDQYGTCSRHFWRGVLDFGGGFSMADSRMGNPQPRIQLAGSYHFLMKFLAFLLEELGPIDSEGKLAFMCSGHKLMFSGQLAQRIAVLLYQDCHVARASNERKADAAMTWTPRR